MFNVFYIGFQPKLKCRLVQCKEFIDEQSALDFAFGIFNSTFSQLICVAELGMIDIERKQVSGKLYELEVEGFGLYTSEDKPVFTLRAESQNIHRYLPEPYGEGKYRKVIKGGAVLC